MATKYKPRVNWFSPNDLLSYNALFNFVIGVRGGGKSFGTLQFCVNRFLKYGEEFIYLRRYETELDNSKPTLFQALLTEGKFPGYELFVKGERMYAKKGDQQKCMGYTMALSTSMKKKSIPFAKVKWIIFEEFMRSEEHTSELQSRPHLVCRLLLEKKNT